MIFTVQYNLFSCLCVILRMEIIIISKGCNARYMPWNPTTVKPIFKDFWGANGYEYKFEENLKWGQFNTGIIDLGTLTFNVKLRKTSNQGE